MKEITLLQPDDWHLHLRDGAALAAVLPDTALRFGRAIVMPNLKPPITTVVAAAEYRLRILDALKARAPGVKFEPLMTLYLTNNTTADEVRKAKASGFVHAVKYYPAGATTNSDAGVTDIRNCDAVFEAMQEIGLPLLMHGEVIDGDVDVFDREATFIERHLKPLVERFPGLRVVLEHITTREAADFVTAAGPNIAATITAHHLLLNRNAIFQGGLRPHHYCLPVLKREVHRQALVQAATSGNAKFFLGTDSAPHPKSNKESHCCGAGIYTAHAGIELYAEVFATENALDKLEGFASRNGPAFYKLPTNEARVTLVADAWKVPEKLPFLDNDPLTPLRAGGEIGWRMVR
jgi:dihydroorotase